MRLHHLHLPGLTPYLRASHHQETLVSRFLLSKKDPSAPSPPPTLLTFMPPPTYTSGRREALTVSAAQTAHLTAPYHSTRAAFHPTQRGGQTTYHGPGQLVAYPLLSLRAHALTPRCYVRLLENCIIDTCAAYGIRAFTTEHTGVWTSAEEKIASVGVHMRRHVTSHGIALNVATELGWFERIVACGLPGKRAVSMSVLEGRGEGRAVGTVQEVAGVFAGMVAKRLEGLEDGEVVRVGVEEAGAVLGLDLDRNVDARIVMDEVR